mgnify:CR=1 FL=1
MPIKPENLDVLDEVESGLKNASFDFIEKNFHLATDTLREYRALQITVLSLATAIAGIVIPVLLSTDLTGFAKDTLFIAILLFGANVIWGITYHAYRLSNEGRHIWENSDIKLKQLTDTIEEVRRIRRMDDNNEAGKALIQIRQKVEGVMKKNKIGNKSRSYVGEIIFFSLFIAALGLTFISIAGILVN